MDMRTLRRRCEARLRDLALPNPFDIEQFVAAVAGRRGRPILLFPHTLVGGPTRICVRGDGIDMIYYRGDAPSGLRTLIILHELAHILCDHASVSLAGETAPTHLPLPSPHGLRRTVFASDDEREAELMASLIAWRIARMSPVVATTDAETAALRLAVELEGEE